MTKIKDSELIINNDGSIFHLHLKPEQLADTVILVGDPSRTEMVASFFDSIEFKVQNREFKSITGSYSGSRITVLSTGIGTDNIDIVMNELDALANIDFASRQPKDRLKQLRILRIGTSGSIQENIPVGSFVISEKSIGFDGVLNFYKARNNVSDLEFEQDFKDFTQWNTLLASPYVVDADEETVNLLHSEKSIKGITISANGFYGPQGRVLRLPLQDEHLNEKISKFRHRNRQITNYEMESSAITGLSRLLGHKACTICLIIANRANGEALPDYHSKMKELIKYSLNKLTN